MKIFLLLYADDTLLFSETYEGMQNLLDVFSDYCKLWKLEVNLSKTKTVTFSKRKFRFFKHNINLYKELLNFVLLFTSLHQYEIIRSFTRISKGNLPNKQSNLE
jgi:hypothetical protein